MAKQVKKLLQSRTGVGGSLEMGNLGNAKKKEFFSGIPSATVNVIFSSNTRFRVKVILLENFPCHGFFVVLFNIVVCVFVCFSRLLCGLIDHN